MSLVTVRVKNRLDRTIKEVFPIYGLIKVGPRATTRVPVDVALAWADPTRHVGIGALVDVLDPIGGFVQAVEDDEAVAPAPRKGRPRKNHDEE